MNRIGAADVEQAIEEIEASLSDDPTGRTLFALDAIQERFGYVPDEALGALGALLDIPAEQLRSVRDFFSGYYAEPIGEHVIEICDGTACHLRRAPEIIQLIEQVLDLEVGQTSLDGKCTLRAVKCVGSCGSAPVVSIDGRTIAKMSLPDAAQIVRFTDERS